MLVLDFLRSELTTQELVFSEVQEMIADALTSHLSPLTSGVDTPTKQDEYGTLSYLPTVPPKLVTLRTYSQYVEEREIES